MAQSCLSVFTCAARVPTSTPCSPVQHDQTQPVLASWAFNQTIYIHKSMQMLWQKALSHSSELSPFVTLFNRDDNPWQNKARPSQVTWLFGLWRVVGCPTTRFMTKSHIIWLDSAMSMPQMLGPLTFKTGARLQANYNGQLFAFIGDARVLPGIKKRVTTGLNYKAIVR